MLKLLLLFILLFLTFSIQAKQYALIVGINQYQATELKTLQGAVNDARLISQALKQANITQQWLLLDKKATKSAFLQAWQAILQKAQPGDTIIISFAGHGAQIPDTNGDEEDHKDEIIIFYDMNQRKNSGFISDDALFDLFAKASDYNIIFISDSCHSGGITRNIYAKTTRFAGDLVLTDLAIPTAIATPSKNIQKLPHVTYITASDNEALEVSETSIDGKIHGALSYFFAKAMIGEADQNKDKKLSRMELLGYLREKVRNHMNHTQNPSLLPRGDATNIVAIQTTKPSQPPKVANIPITVINGNPPNKLQGFYLDSYDYALKFIIKGNITEVYNNTNDLLTKISTQDLNAWQKSIARAALIAYFKEYFKPSLGATNISLKQGDNIHKKGKILDFSFAPNPKVTLTYFTLINLAGNGELQYLYPIYYDKPYITQYPYSLSLQVTPPYGSDHLIAIFCKKQPNTLQTLLKRHDGLQAPTSDQVKQALTGETCQIGQYSIFTKE